VLRAVCFCAKQNTNQAQQKNFHIMANPLNTPSTKTIILVGLLGCFLTSVAGVSGSMFLSGWDASGGWLEWIKRLGLGYPCACLVVLSVFPRLVPKMTRLLEGQ
jgi:hypothetical protein